MKFALTTLSLLTLSSSAFAYERNVDYVETGTPCALEGERVYVQKGEDQDVFECKDGKWSFLFMRLPNDRD